MKKFFVLAGVQLKAMLSSMRVGGSRKRAASGWAALLLAAGLCVYISGFYSFAIAGQLAEIGALHLLLLWVPAMAVIAGLFFTAFAAQGVVFGGRDADLLLSMPVPSLMVLGAKLIALYAENLVFCLFLALPAGAAWLWHGGGGGLLFVLRLLVGVLFLTLLPTVLSLAAGGVLSWLGGRFANRKAVNLLLYALLMVGVFVAGIQINLGVSALMAGELMAEIGDVSTGWELPFLWFQRGVCGSWGELGGFCLGMLALALLAAGVCARFYQQILTGLRSYGRRAAYRFQRMNAAGRRCALLRKEAERYFGTPIYLFNTGIGLVLMPVAGIAAVVMGGKLRDMLAQAGMGGMPLLSLAAAVIAFLVSTVAITGSSISLEGKCLWILKEAPIPARELLNVKAGFHLLLVCPCVLVYSVGMAWGLGLTLAEGAALLAAGAAFAGFTALLGLTANLCFPKLDALNDMVVVKQSAAAFAATLGGMAAALACGGVVWGLTVSGLAGETAAMGVCAGLLLAGCAILYGWLQTRGVERFQGLV